MSAIAGILFSSIGAMASGIFSLIVTTREKEKGCEI
jgi:hypothetical protein